MELQGSNCPNSGSQGTHAKCVNACSVCSGDRRIVLEAVRALIRTISTDQRGGERDAVVESPLCPSTSTPER